MVPKKGLFQGHFPKSLPYIGLRMITSVCAGYKHILNFGYSFYRFPNMPDFRRERY